MPAIPIEKPVKPRFTNDEPSPEYRQFPVVQDGRARVRGTLPKQSTHSNEAIQRYIKGDFTGFRFEEDFGKFEVTIGLKGVWYCERLPRHTGQEIGILLTVGELTVKLLHDLAVDQERLQREVNQWRQNNSNS